MNTYFPVWGGKEHTKGSRYLETMREENGGMRSYEAEVLRTGGKPTGMVSGVGPKAHCS